MTTYSDRQNADQQDDAMPKGRPKAAQSSPKGFSDHTASADNIAPFERRANNNAP
jgi:hypothetical protein